MEQKTKPAYKVATSICSMASKPESELRIMPILVRLSNVSIL